MNTLIFGDAHLRVDPDEEQARAEFIGFLREILRVGCRRLFIVGDLFDFWFEYKHVVFSGYFEVLRAFSELRDGGTEIHLICGNHDFWAGRFLEGDLGFTIHQEAYACTLGNRRVLFAHGDGLNRRDYGYRAYKWVARSRLAIWLFGKLHPDLAMAIAQRLSRGSRALRGAKDGRRGREVLSLQRFAEEILEGDGADVVICGHSHHPVVQEIPAKEKGKGGVYINVGGWMDHHMYVEWDGASFELKQYKPGAGLSDAELSEEDNAHVTEDVAGGETAQAEQKAHDQPQ